MEKYRPLAIDLGDAISFVGDRTGETIDVQKPLLAPHVANLDAEFAKHIPNEGLKGPIEPIDPNSLGK